MRCNCGPCRILRKINPLEVYRELRSFIWRYRHIISQRNPEYEKAVKDHFRKVKQCKNCNGTGWVDHPTVEAEMKCPQCPKFPHHISVWKKT